jgi:hypothetical protein
MHLTWTRDGGPERDGQAQPRVSRRPEPPALLHLQGLVGNRAVAGLVHEAGPLTVLQRCGPTRPDCGCSDDERAAAEQAPAREPTRVPTPARAGCDHGEPAIERWMGAAPARFGPPLRTCALEDQTPESEEAGEPVADSDEVPVRETPGSPRAGDATIVCNGTGGYRVDMGSWAGAPCGIEGCVRRHEQQHIADWQGRWPDGCKGKKNGDTIPLGGTGYAAFLKASECSAYTVERNCIAPLAAKAKTEPCKTRLKDHLDDTERQKKSYC